MRNVLTMFGRRLECLWLDTDLPSALRLFKQGKAHMALVRDVVTTVNKWVGACVCVCGGGGRASSPRCVRTFVVLCVPSVVSRLSDLKKKKCVGACVGRSQKEPPEANRKHTRTNPKYRAPATRITSPRAS